LNAHENGLLAACPHDAKKWITPPACDQTIFFWLIRFKRTLSKMKKYDAWRIFTQTEGLNSSGEGVSLPCPLQLQEMPVSFSGLVRFHKQA
jgi:hypothetical protein